MLPVIVNAPSGSKFLRAPSTRLSLMKIGVRASTSTPIGTLTKKIHSQPRALVRMPPSRTPIAAPLPPSAPQTPSALLRSDPSANAWLTMESADGRSEEHTSELQSRVDLVCRLLL